MSRALKNIRLRAATFGRPTQLGGAGQKGVVAADAARIGVQGRPRYPDAGGESLARAHRRNELVFACVRAKGFALAKPRLIVEQRTESDTYEEIVGHPLRRLLVRPNDAMDSASFFRALVVSRDVYGRFYGEKLFSPAGAIVGLNPLDPKKMRFITGTDAAGTAVVTAWEWRDGAARATFRPEELLIWQPQDWVDPPAAEVALGSVDSDTAQTDYVRAFFNNAGVPSGILKLKRGNVTQPEVDRVKSRWRESYGRASGNQHEIAVLDDGADYQKIGAGLDELESATVRSVSESRICMAFGVPPLIVYAYSGLLRATYSNLKEAMSGFWDLTIDPLLGDIAAWLTMTLLEEFEGRERVLAEQVRLRWDVSQVAALQEDQDARHTRARADFMAGVILLNEARAQVGQDADPAGDYYLRGIAQQPVPYGVVEQLIEGEPAGPSDAPKAAARLRALGARALKAASLGPIERRLLRELEQALADDYRDAADAIRQQGED